VDDDIRMLRMMQMIMEADGYRVLTANNGQLALNIFLAEESLDLVLLDIRLPDMDGYTVCRRIREFSQIPIIMVTVKGNDEEKVAGLDAGADDYVTKPFSSDELAARVRAVLRRAKLWDERPVPAFRSGELVVDFTSHKVAVAGEEIDLTATEYRILSYLARNAGRLVTSGQILEKVWGEEYMGETNLLQVNIARLRHKLKDDVKNPRYILTKPGIGYTMPKDIRPS